MHAYIVQPGDTLYSIARLFRVTTDRLRALNPLLDNAGLVSPGQVLYIPATGVVRPIIEVNGYTFVTSTSVPWDDVFPYLTYLSIFGHELRPGGGLTVPDTAQLTASARQAHVAPLMTVTNTVDGVYSGDLLHSVLSDDQARRALIANCASIAQTAGFYGVNFGFEYILPEDYDAYAAFLEQAANQLHALGLIIVASIRLIVALQNQAQLMPALSLYSRILDRLILTPGDLTCTQAASPIDVLQLGLDYVSRYVSNPKILLGIPNCCYEWEAPYMADNGYREVPLDEADAIIRGAGASQQIDPYTQRIYFQIPGEGGAGRVLMCDSAYNLQTMELVDIYNLGGVSFRTLSLFTLASLQPISVRHDIRKVLP